jgi:putative CGCGG family rSAM target protein
MSETDAADERDATAIDDGDDPVTDRDAAADLPAFLTEEHAGSWSANLERDRYADDRETLVDHALRAVARTDPAHHVNLVTHPEHGDPEPYLGDRLREEFPEATAAVVDQCGCGGYVYRVAP